MGTRIAHSIFGMLSLKSFLGTLMGSDNLPLNCNSVLIGRKGIVPGGTTIRYGSGCFTEIEDGISSL